MGEGKLIDAGGSIDQYYTHNNSRSTAPDTFDGPQYRSTHGTERKLGKIGTAGGARVVSTTRASKPNSQFNSPHKFGHIQNASVDDSLLGPGTIASDHH